MKSIRNMFLIVFIACAIISLDTLPALQQNTITENNQQDIIISLQTSDNHKRTIKVSPETAEMITADLKELQIKIDQNEISELEYFEQFIELFKKEGIIPEEYSLRLFQLIGEKLQEKLSITTLDEQLSSRLTQDTALFANDPKTIPIHLGRATIIGSISFGNYLVRRVIPFKPFGFYEVFSKELFIDYNLSSFFTYASACIWTPGPRGHHVLYSFIPYPGLQSFSQKIFLDKSIGGIFLLGANISLEAFTEDGENVLFDATIGVYGADLMMGFGI